MKLIGLAGFKTSGKDSTYQFIDAVYAGTVQRVAFADKLKIMAARALGLEDDDAELITLMDAFKENGDLLALAYAPSQSIPIHFHQRISGRQYLQNFGQRAREVFGDDFWVDQILPKPSTKLGLNSHNLAFRYPHADVLCVTDCRYPNEAKRIKELGGVVWEVQRPGLESDGHSSERPLPRSLVDHVVRNTGTLEDLRVEAKNALEFTL